MQRTAQNANAASRAILLTGATGFVGSRLLPRLRAAFPHRALIALGREAPPDNPPDGVTGGVLELSDPQSVRTVIEAAAPGVVIHLAGQASVAGAGGAPWEAWKDNMLGAATLAETMCALAPDAAFVFASTAEVYGRSFAAGGPLDETAPLQPVGAYARGKAAAEYALQDIFAGSDVRLVNLRIFNHVGAGQGERFVASAFAAQLARMEAGLIEPVMRTGNLDVERDFGHVDDLVSAFTAVVASEARMDALNVFNVCSGRSRPVRAVLDTLIALSSVQPTVETDPQRVRPGEMARIVGSHAALTATTGWLPTRPVEDALGELMADWRRRVRSKDV